MDCSAAGPWALVPLLVAQTKKGGARREGNKKWRGGSNVKISSVLPVGAGVKVRLIDKLYPDSQCISSSQYN